MNARRVTQVLIAVVVVGLAAWDFVPGFFAPEDGDTISEVVREIGFARPSFVFAFCAVLVGHFFGPEWFAENVRSRFPWSPFALLALALVVVGLDFGGVIGNASPWVVAVVGTVAGAVLWPQERPERPKG